MQQNDSLVNSYCYPSIRREAGLSEVDRDRAGRDIRAAHVRDDDRDGSADKLLPPELQPQFEVIWAIMLDDSTYVLHEQSTHLQPGPEDSVAERHPACFDHNSR